MYFRRASGQNSLYCLTVTVLLPSETWKITVQNLTQTLTEYIIGNFITTVILYWNCFLFVYKVKLNSMKSQSQRTNLSQTDSLAFRWFHPTECTWPLWAYLLYNEIYWRPLKAYLLYDEMACLWPAVLTVSFDWPRRREERHAGDCQTLTLLRTLSSVITSIL